MKIQITLNGIKTEKDIPVSYEQITFRTFLSLIPCGNDPVEILSVLLGIEGIILRRSKIENLSNIIQALSFVNIEPQYIIPKKVLGYPIPKDLEMETFAQYGDIQRELATSANHLNTIEKYPLLIATYCVDYTKENAWKEAEKLAPKFLDLPCMEVMAIGNFTLVKLTVLKQNIKPHFRQADTHLNKLKLAMIVLLKRLAFTIRFYSWSRKLRSIEMRYSNGQ
jgi:hypothetical protein